MNQQQIEQQAAEWLALRDSDRWTPENEARLERWLDESTAHTVNFIRMETAWRKADRFKALGAGFAVDVVPTPEQFNVSSQAGLGVPVLREQVSRARSTRKRSIAIAASVVLAAGAAIIRSVWPPGPSYSTPVGGLASVPMQDGSKITLNTDSAVRVEVTETARRVDLKQGEAFFEVVPDAKRSFVVNAGSRSVVVLGTRFSVRREGGEIQVQVTEGKVRIENGDPGGAVELVAGGVAHTATAGTVVQSRPVAEVQESLSWRSGYVVLWDADLAQAVAEFNRYNERKLALGGEIPQAVKLTGKFKATNVDAFVRLLEDGFGVRAHKEGDKIVLQRM